MLALLEAPRRRPPLLNHCIAPINAFWRLQTALQIVLDTQAREPAQFGHPGGPAPANTLHLSGARRQAECVAGPPPLGASPQPRARRRYECQRMVRAGMVVLKFVCRCWLADFAVGFCCSCCNGRWVRQEGRVPAHGCRHAPPFHTCHLHPCRRARGTFADPRNAAQQRPSARQPAAPPDRPPACRRLERRLSRGMPLQLRVHSPPAHA